MLREERNAQHFLRGIDAAWYRPGVKRFADLPRRRVLEMLGAAALGGVACKSPSTTTGPTEAGAGASGSLVFPQKARDLIVLADRPPNLEMPLHYLSHDLTPNEAFFVRWHLMGVPTRLDRRTFKLRVAGHVEREIELSVDELERMSTVEIVAVNQCSGNGRGLSSPRVPGVQWTNGAIGNARWRGVPLKDLLAKAGIKAGAVDVTFRGADQPPLPATPAFVKSLSVEQALDPDVLVATSMNGAPLPVLNGFPVRLVVPGRYSTYWIKSLERIEITSAPFDGYWMAKAYRIPKNDRANESPDDLAKETTPIGRMNVRSLLVPPAGKLQAGSRISLEGVAFDGGSGIRNVEVSTDGGATWQQARLDADLGKYSFRRFRAEWTPPAAGTFTLLSRATSVAGETQSAEPRWNRAGYMRNVPEPLEVKVS
jgi:DMSO/TMAO reductase YedYZ molybdopterin-dependent catalytic subunit